MTSRDRAQLGICTHVGAGSRAFAMAGAASKTCAPAMTRVRAAGCAHVGTNAKASAPAMTRVRAAGYAHVGTNAKTSAPAMTRVRADGYAHVGANVLRFANMRGAS